MSGFSQQVCPGQIKPHLVKLEYQGRHQQHPMVLYAPDPAAATDPNASSGTSSRQTALSPSCSSATSSIIIFVTSSLIPYFYNTSKNQSAARPRSEPARSPHHSVTETLRDREDTASPGATASRLAELTVIELHREQVVVVVIHLFHLLFPVHFTG